MKYKKHTDTQRLNKLIELIEEAGGGDCFSGRDFDQTLYLAKGRTDKLRYRNALDEAIETA